MRVIRPLVAAAFAVGALSPALAPKAALAQQAAPSGPEQEQRLKLASDLIEIMNLRPMMAQMVTATSTGIGQAYAKQSGAALNDANKKTIEDVVKANMAKKLPELLPLLAPATAQSFTVEELKAIVDFYRSPVGQSILEKLPPYMAGSGRLVASWMQQNQAGLQKQILTELDQKGIKVAAPQAAAQPGAGPAAAPAAAARPAAPTAPATAQPARPAAPTAPAVAQPARPAPAAPKPQ